ncbi:MAG: methyltransferase domain-containing protein, partial [Verrucomicrobiota bacterium]|nr:methyltransferase domain-containing protein [Verrucomicrobiota bacterium]
MSSAPRTWGERLVQARLRLGRAGIEEAETKLRWLQAHILQCGLLDGLRYHADIPAPGEAFAFEAGVSRLEKDEPVQYILGETDFMGLRIFCDSRALIPRPETELLVQCAQDCAKAVPPPCRMVDVGTGTGCIACALAKRLPGAQVTAVDISPDSLALAR